jgi:segregation and condensation protein B
MNKIEKQIEAIIFYKGEEISFKEISDIVNCSVDIVSETISKLKDKFKDGGINLITNENSVMMATGEDASVLIEKIEQEEYEKELSKAAYETLTIILYRGPIKRSMIDFIRGVNSQFTLRNLLIRGLVEKITDKSDERSYLYKPTMDLLRFMNITNVTDLQEYKEINQKIDSFIKNSKENEE